MMDGAAARLFGMEILGIQASMKQGSYSLLVIGPLTMCQANSDSPLPEQTVK
jgi:hypothetical protein